MKLNSLVILITFLASGAFVTSQENVTDSSISTNVPGDISVAYPSEATTITDNTIVTTEATTASIISELPAVDDKITVWIAGKNRAEYVNNTILILKNVLSEMANDFCDQNSIALNSSVTRHNVNITYLNGCPSNWVESNTCIILEFAIPVDFANPDSFVYQLNSTNLKKMWEDMANKYISSMRLKNYVKRDPAPYLTIWILVFSLTLIIFMVALYLVRCIIKRSMYKSQRKGSIFGDMTNIWSDRTNPSEFPLGPHPLQEIPPFFQSQIRDFEPGKGDFEPTSMYASEKRIGKTYGYDTLDEKDDNTIYVRKFANYPQGSVA